MGNEFNLGKMIEDPYGHMTECHYPLTCEEARCSHYLQELEVIQ